MSSKEEVIQDVKQKIEGLQKSFMELTEEYRHSQIEKDSLILKLEELNQEYAKQMKYQNKSTTQKINQEIKQSLKTHIQEKDKREMMNAELENQFYEKKMMMIELLEQEQQLKDQENSLQRQVNMLLQQNQNLDSNNSQFEKQSQKKEEEIRRNNRIMKDQKQEINQLKKKLSELQDVNNVLNRVLNKQKYGSVYRNDRSIEQLSYQNDYNMNNNNRDYQMEDDFWFGDKKTRLPQI